MDFISKLVLVEDGEGFFGPGVRDLLLNIDKERSVKAACERMQISYSKAWKIIRNVEKAMGETAVVRVHGGNEGGSASLTDSCRALLESYMRVENRSKDAIRAIIDEEFSR